MDVRAGTAFADAEGIKNIPAIAGVARSAEAQRKQNQGHQVDGNIVCNFFSFQGAWPPQGVGCRQDSASGGAARKKHDRVTRPVGYVNANNRRKKMAVPFLCGWLGPRGLSCLAGEAGSPSGARGRKRWTGLPDPLLAKETQTERPPGRDYREEPPAGGPLWASEHDVILTLRTI